MKLKVKDLRQPLRIDSYIFETLEDTQNTDNQILSRSMVQSLIKTGDILLNGRSVKKNAKVTNGDEIEITLRERETGKIVPEDIDIDIVYEDDDVLVVNKKRGMVVHPAIANYSGTLVNAILYHVKNQGDHSYFDENVNVPSAKVRPGIVHRIDKDTTGLLMIAKNDYSHLCLSKQLKERTVTRKYIALVHGGFKEEEGFVDAPIKRHRRDRLKMAVDPGGKRALTRYKVLERLGTYTLLELKLDTGRTHQIRVHMKHLKHPLVGDSTYGARNCKYSGMGQLLHAETLGFVHPKSGEYMEFHSPLPEDFQRVLNKERENVK